MLSYVFTYFGIKQGIYYSKSIVSRQKVPCDSCIFCLKFICNILLKSQPQFLKTNVLSWSVSNVLHKRNALERFLK